MGTTGDLWSSFTHDPRARAHAHVRASDADRELVFRVLSEAYADGRLERDEHDQRMAGAAAALMLGQIPPLVADLVPLRSPVLWASRSLVGVTSDQLHERAVERYADRRRGAAYLFLGTAVLGWGMVALAGWEHSWLLVFNALALLQLGRVLLSREEMVRDEVRRLERRQVRQQRWARALPPGPWQP